MAAVELTISGVLYDKYARTTRPVVLIGEASLTGLGVGGGPVYPPSGGGGTPSHPIALPGDPWWGQDLRPEHPIVLPEPPTEPPTNPADDQGWVKPPPESGWGYHETYGWLYNPGPAQAGPKK